MTTKRLIPLVDSGRARLNLSIMLKALQIRSILRAKRRKKGKFKVCIKRQSFSITIGLSFVELNFTFCFRKKAQIPPKIWPQPNYEAGNEVLMVQNNENDAQTVDSEETFALLEKLYEEASNSELF